MVSMQPRSSGMSNSATRRNTPPLTDKVRQGLEDLITCHPENPAAAYLRAMLEAHAARELKRERRKEQNAERRKVKVPKLIEFEGRAQSLAAWCKEKGVSYGAAHGRLERGCSVEEALSPVSRLNLTAATK